MLKFLKKLVKPTRVLEAPELRRRITTLNTLMLTYTFFVFVMLISSFFLDFKTSEEEHGTQIILLICTLIFSGACALGRTPHYVTSGLLFTLTIYAGCAVAPFQTHNVDTLKSVLPFLVIPALIGTFLFPLKIAILNLAVGLGLSLGLGYVFDLHESGSSGIYLVLFNIIAYAILFIGTMLREWDERQMLDDRVHLVKNSKMQTLGQMAGNIAHEMNSPLGAIVLRGSQIARVLRRTEDVHLEKDRLIAMACDIEKIGKDIALIVEGLRRFSINDESQDYQAVRVALAIESTLRICKQKIESNGIRLNIPAFDQGLEIFGSEVQLSQVLLNLLTNAQQAVANLPEKWIELRIDASPEGIEISVTDSGRGIPSPIAARIFEPFFTTKPIGEGTGLGLSISYGIIAKLNGRLYVDARCSNTRFVVSLPRLRKNPGSS